MKCKTNFLLSFTAIIATSFIMLFSCQDDDVCDRQISPRITVVFLDDFGNNKVLDSIYIDRLNADMTRTNLIESAATDSIQVVLTTLNNPEKYIVHLTETGPTDTLTVDYDFKNEFVSKACGFKSTFSNVYFTSTTVLIRSITQNTTSIIDESQTSLFINY